MSEKDNSGRFVRARGARLRAKAEVWELAGRAQAAPSSWCPPAGPEPRPPHRGGGPAFKQRCKEGLGLQGLGQCGRAPGDRAQLDAQPTHGHSACSFSARTPGPRLLGSAGLHPSLHTLHPLRQSSSPPPALAHALPIVFQARPTQGGRPPGRECPPAAKAILSPCGKWLGPPGPPGT